MFKKLVQFCTPKTTALLPLYKIPQKFRFSRKRSRGNNILKTAALEI